MLMMRSLQNHCVASADHVHTGGGLMLMMCLVLRCQVMLMTRSFCGKRLQRLAVADDAQPLGILVCTAEAG